MNNRQNNLGEVVLYKTEDGKTALDVRLASETVWQTQAQIADLFGVIVPAVSKHIQNIFSVRELAPKATVSKMEIVRIEMEQAVQLLSRTLTRHDLVPGKHDRRYDRM